MKIDYSNAQIINSPDFCMHDDWFVNMNYECGKDTNTMNVHFIKYYKAKDYIVKFNNVIGFDISTKQMLNIIDKVFK